MVDKINSRYPGYSCRPLDKKNFYSDVENIRSIYNRAWEKNWGFVPWTDAQLNDMAKQLKPLVVPELTPIAFHQNDPIGFLLAIPDYNEIIKKIGRHLFPTGWIKFLRLKGSIQNLRLMAMGVVKEFQNKGAGALLYYNALMAARENGYKECEYSWILEDNYDTLRIARMMGAEVYKTYRIYDKPL
jgi:GNAT superfamily N-acetyltransferase